MLFRLVLQDKDATILGYEWLEVLAIVPFRFTFHDAYVAEGETKKKGIKGMYAIAQASFYCRSEVGIVSLSEDDVMHEVSEGIYCEPGGEAEAKKTREGREAFTASQ